MKRTSIILISLILIILIDCRLDGTYDESYVTVSGNVSHNSEPVVGAFMVLLQQAEVSDTLSLTNLSYTNNKGDYTLFDVSEGKYFLAAIHDKDRDKKLSAGDGFGFFGIDPESQDFLPDTLFVYSESLEDINITYMGYDTE
jgi:hypothetical protein